MIAQINANEIDSSNERELLEVKIYSTLISYLSYSISIHGKRKTTMDSHIAR